MSELIDNRRHRVEALKGVIRELHAGAGVDELKSRFRAVLDHAGAGEISAMESELMAEGMPETEIRRMCELHVAVFRDKLERQAPADAVPGHPVHTFRRENEAVVALVGEYRRVAAALTHGNGRDEAVARWREVQARLDPLAVHYQRKEYLVFPFLEKAGVTAPPKVMWSLDDEIRERMAAAREAAAGAGELTADDLAMVREVVIEPMLEAVLGMVEKEDRVLWPMALEHLSEAQWGEVQEQWRELGPCLVEPEEGWAPAPSLTPPLAAPPLSGEALRLPSGSLTMTQLVAVLDTLPVDITFVDADDRVAYFSEGRDRVFARNRAIIGRRVQDCHPPASLHVVERIVREMREGVRDLAEFWIRLHGRFVHIRYFAVRGAAASYLGCLEVTQDVAPIRALEGERRLLDEEHVS